MTRNAQAVITDLFIAISVFIILVTIIILTIELYDIRLQSKFDYEDIVIKTFLLSDTLTKSRGIPTNWENNKTTITEIGLAEDERVISDKKFQQFRTNLTDENIKTIMNIQPYNFRLQLKELNGTVIATRGVTPQSQGADIVVNLARIVLHKKTPRVLEFTLWK